MNKIICDNCKLEIPLTKGLIETKYLKGGINITFFRCKCGSKYLIDVTDKEVREKQQSLRLMTNYKADLMKVVNNENLERIEAKTKEVDGKMEEMLKEIKEAKAELKVKYEGEL
jgi:hypothetical protein